MIYVAAIAIAITAARYSHAVRTTGTPRVLWELPAVILAGLAAGLWLGVASRAAMRVVAIAATASLRLSAGGTIQVVAVFAAIGGGIAILYAGLFRHALDASGFKFGLLLFLATWFPLTKAGEDIIARPVDPAASGIVILLMWMPYAVFLGFGVRRLGAAFPSLSKSAASRRTPK